MIRNRKNHASSSSSAASVMQGFDQRITTQQSRGSSSKNNVDANPSIESWFDDRPPRHLERSVLNNPLFGITFGAWMRLLWKRGARIDWGIYAPRLIALTFLSLINSIGGLIEWCLYERVVQNVTIDEPPVFVLGHPRTGTTLLHSLLALDETRFAICTTFCAGFPSCFLWLEQVYGKSLLAGCLSETRPMDNVRLDFDLPQEDELANNLLSGCRVSPYAPLFFMRDEASFRPFYAFGTRTSTMSNNRTTSSHPSYSNSNDESKESNERHHHEAGEDEYLDPTVMARAKSEWTTAFLYLLRKLLVRDQCLRQRKEQQQQQQHQHQRAKNDKDHHPTRQEEGGRGGRQPQLLLKSPVHTARIGLLLQLFPNAKFLYIHRHPYRVFQSAAHMANTTYPYMYLQRPSAKDVSEFVLRQYEILWHHYAHERPRLLQNGQLMEVAYDDLAQQPKGTMQRIYRHFHWDMDEAFQTKLQEAVRGPVYHTNRYEIPLSWECRQVLHQRWGNSFVQLGYDMDMTTSSTSK